MNLKQFPLEVNFLATFSHIYDKMLVLSLVYTEGSNK